MLRRILTAVVALSLAASAGQGATLTGDQGAPSANLTVSGDQGALSAKQEREFALTIIGDKGTTLVNRGTGFSAVAGTTQLKPGDRIMVRDGAAARITYPDGCNVPVRGIATVDPLSPCNFMAADLPPREPPPEPYVAPVAEDFHTGRWRLRSWPLVGLPPVSLYAVTTTTTFPSSQLSR